MTPHPKDRRWLTVPVAMVMLLGACTNADDATTTTEGSAAPTTVSTTSTTSGEGPGTTEPTSNLPDLGGRRVVVAVDNQTFPFNFNDDGEDTGWDYELLEAMCEGLNCEVEFLEVAPDNVISSVASGDADVASDGATFTDELAEEVDLSAPIIPVEQRLIVRLDETRFDTVGQFSNSDARVGAVEGTANHRIALDTWGTNRTTGFPDLDAAVSALFDGDVDAVVIFDFAGQGYVGDGDDDVKQIQGVLATGEIGLVFTPGSDLVAPFDEALTELTINGTLGTLNAFWFAPASAS